MHWQLGARYRIIYRDREGDETVRTVDILGITAATGTGLYLRAFCHLRGMERSFRSDRILSAELIRSPAERPEVRTPRPEPVAMRADPRPAAAASAAPVYAPSNGRNDADSGSGLGWLVLAMVVVLVVYWADASRVKPDPPAPSTVAAVAPAAVKPAPKPAPPPKPAREEAIIAGRALVTIRSGGTERFQVPSLGVDTASKREAVKAIRLPAYLAVMGFMDDELVERYLAADLNGSGKLAFSELEVFQEKTFREFAYRSNELALRPDEFLKAGGGDCEDFALYTAGLLRFWGWEPYIGSLGPSGRGSGHAVCLSFEEGSVPSGYTRFTIEEAAAWGPAIKPGVYVPIDYDQVGSLSNAVKPGWKLRDIQVPEELWGQYM